MTSRHALPGFGLTLGSALLYLSLMTILPLAALVIKAAGLPLADFWSYISDPRAIATYKLTFRAAFYATVINVLLGLLVAWILVRYEFRGRHFLDALVDLPFALPTAVAGLSIATLTVPQGPIGQLFAKFDIQIAYAFPGIVLAMAFTSFPFVVRTVQPVIADLDVALEETAMSLGAGPVTTFRKVIFPELIPATLAGATVALVRSLGEFGAVVFIAGNLPFRTEITALLIFIRINEYDYPGAAALATVILFLAFTILFLTNIIQRIYFRRFHG